MTAPPNPCHVVLPRPLRALFPAAPAEVAVEARTVAEMVAALDRLWPGMGDRIADSRPAIRKHLNVFVEGERATLQTRIPQGATVFVLTAMSGG